MHRSSMDMSATFGAKVEHVVAESQDVLSLNVKCGAVGCIINGSCKLEHEGASRIIPHHRMEQSEFQGGGWLYLYAFPYRQPHAAC